MKENVKSGSEFDEKARVQLELVLGLLRDEYVAGDIKTFENFVYSAIVVARDYRGLSYSKLSEDDRGAALFRVLQEALEQRPAERTEVSVPRELQLELMRELDRWAGRDGALRKSGGGPALVFSKEPAGKAESAFEYGARQLNKLGFMVSSDTVERYRKEHTKGKRK